MSGNGSMYWTTMVETLTSQMNGAIRDVNVEAVESVMRLQRSVCTSRSTRDHVGHVDWSKQLIQAIKTGHTEIVRAILRTHPDVNYVYKDDTGRRALHYAAEIGSADIVKQVLNAGSSINVPAGNGETALHIAAEMGHSNVTLLLLSEGASVNRPKTYNGESPLHTACRKGRVEIVKFMLAKGGLVSNETQEGLMPIHLAARAKQLEVARILSALGAQVNLPDAKYGKTPVYHAAETGCEEMVELLIKYGADVSIKDKRERTALHALAASNSPTGGHLRVVDSILNHVPTEVINLQDEKGCTALHYSAALGNVKILQLLLDHGADLDTIDSNDESALNTAVGHKRIEAAKLLILAGANVNIVDSGQASPLHNVHSIRGEAKVPLVELLIKHGAKLNVLTGRGYSPLDRCVFHYVIGNYDKEILKMLVKAGIRLKPVLSQPGRPQHNSPLCWLTWHNHISSGQFLVRAGWDLRHETWLGLPGKTKAAEIFITSLREQSQEAPSLWNECRRTIRDVLLQKSNDTDVEPYVEKLPVPAAVKKHLLFHEELNLFQKQQSK